MSMNDYLAEWDFGPAKGYYSILVRRGDELYSAPYVMLSKGSHLLSPFYADVLYFRIFYVGTDGHDIISPEFSLRLPSQDRYRFEKE